jgi:hypothetical protein
MQDPIAPGSLPAGRPAVSQSPDGYLVLATPKH